MHVRGRASSNRLSTDAATLTAFDAFWQCLAVPSGERCHDNVNTGPGPRPGAGVDVEQLRCGGRKWTNNSSKIKKAEGATALHSTIAAVLYNAEEYYIAVTCTKSCFILETEQ